MMRVVPNGRPSLLEQVREIQATLVNKKDNDEDEVKRLLRGLDALNISVDVLAETQVGREVRRWRKHPKVGKMAAQLIQKWKDLRDSALSSDSSAPVARTKSDGAPPRGRVCNVKVQYIRAQGYNTLREWMADTERNVYIGRRGVVFVVAEGEENSSKKRRFPPTDSPWCNPFRITRSTTRQEVVQQYEAWLRQKLEEQPALAQELLALEGKNLGCWCHPEACHGHVLLRMIGELKKKFASPGEVSPSQDSGGSIETSKKRRDADSESDNGFRLAADRPLRKKPKRSSKKLPNESPDS